MIPEEAIVFGFFFVVLLIALILALLVIFSAPPEEKEEPVRKPDEPTAPLPLSVAEGVPGATGEKRGGAETIPQRPPSKATETATNVEAARRKRKRDEKIDNALGNGITFK